jgi:hypothetical protein
MTIKRFTSTKDTTITNAFKDDMKTRGTLANMGNSDILEVFSIYGQESSTSLERCRTLIQFPIDEIKKSRSLGDIPNSGSVTFKLKMFNAPHGSTTPDQCTITAQTILQPWEEGHGLDMEGYIDTGATNWVSSSLETPWYTEGGSYLSPDNYGPTFNIPREFKQTLEHGDEDIDIDITAIVEEWIRGPQVAATGSINFSTNPPDKTELKLYATNGDHRIFILSDSPPSNHNKTIYVKRSADIDTTVASLVSATDATPIFRAVDHATQGKYEVFQVNSGIHGNTVISSSLSSGVTIQDFASGTGASNRGLMIKLSGSFEDGTRQRSYYTKRMFARGSEYFLKRPVIEAQYDMSVLDDRGQIQRSVATAPTADNINSIYLYNRIRGRLIDLPDIGSRLIVRFVSSIGTTDPDVSMVGSSVTHNKKYTVASKVSTGIYKVDFEYTGNLKNLADIWLKDAGNGANAEAQFTHLATGSLFKVHDDKWDDYDSPPLYSISAKNFKAVYRSSENVKLRFHTRDKSWKPNIYSVASTTSPVQNIREGFYKVKRVADNLTVIPFSTGSSPQYSRLSYDVSGSYVELDMSILAPNYLYEISILRKDGSNYIEQEERFKFRVDP